MAVAPRLSTPVDRPSVTTVLANAVASDIRSRALKPGDRIGTQRELAARFSVAVATLREALRQLEVLGFITIRHGSGIFVGDRFDRTVVASKITDHANLPRLVQLLDARSTLEPSIAEQAAQVRDQRGLTMLHGTLDLARQHVEAGDETLWRINIDIHRAIAATSGNPILEEVIDSILLAHAKDQRAILMLHGDAQQDFSEHEHLVQLITDGQADEVRAAMRIHLRDVAKVVRESTPTDPPH